METNLKFNSAICTSRHQSKRLLALGLKEETADIVIRPDNTLIVITENSFIYHNLEKATQEGYCPAWSLHRLIEIYDKTCIFWADCFDNPYEAMISRIAGKIKCGELNKEYLE